MSPLAPPKPFARLVRFWRLDPRLSKAWSRACATSTAPGVRSWWHDLRLFQVTRFGTGESLLRQTCSPQRLVAVLEALADEGRLTRVQATRIEDTLLTYVSRTGEWIAGTYDPQRLSPEEIAV